MFTTFLVLTILGIFFPRFTNYCIIAPILGFMSGGFVWCLLVLFLPGDTFANAQSFLGFIGGATIFAAFVISK